MAVVSCVGYWAVHVPLAARFNPGIFSYVTPSFAGGHLPVSSAGDAGTARAWAPLLADVVLHTLPGVFALTYPGYCLHGWPPSKPRLLPGVVVIVCVYFAYVLFALAALLATGVSARAGICACVAQLTRAAAGRDMGHPVRRVAGHRLADMGGLPGWRHLCSLPAIHRACAAAAPPTAALLTRAAAAPVFAVARRRSAPGGAASCRGRCTRQATEYGRGRE